MSNEENAAVRAAADRVIELEEELEAGGQASVDRTALDAARAALHKWVDEMTGVVVSPGLGRVTVLHGNGRPSTIASPDLPYRMSAPVRPHSEG
jgi:hypothetical protein